jgi:hypothetical protein
MVALYRKAEATPKGLSYAPILFHVEDTTSEALISHLGQPERVLRFQSVLMLTGTLFQSGRGALHTIPVKPDFRTLPQSVERWSSTPP